MKAKISITGIEYNIDLEEALDISIPFISNSKGPKCFYAPNFKVEPVQTENFIGDTQQGGLVNFFNIQINPHGNGTHTECVGHISQEKIKLRDCLKHYHFEALLITVKPTTKKNGDNCIELKDLKAGLKGTKDLPSALVVRTQPNRKNKKTQDYSGTNPVYFNPKTIKWMIDRGVDHLLTDLPSVDKEYDGGKLLSHKMFWDYPSKIFKHKTITELIFVENSIKDGNYLLNLMVGDYDLDVSPSKPILYRLL